MTLTGAANWALTNAPANTRFFPNVKVLTCKIRYIIKLKGRANAILALMDLALHASMDILRIVATLANVIILILIKIACGVLSDPYYPGGIFCSIPTTTPTAWVSCRDGYIDPSGKCVSKCPSGYYGSPESFQTPEGTV